jgi:hypothetical protein
MPDETLIAEIETILNQVVELGAEKERTRMVPNLLITNASPAGLSNFIIVQDDRDGDNILATKVPGVIYNTNDLVNVLFIRGGEAIAFQQGSGSSSSGLWEIVLGSSTDIYYNAGNVGIGKSVAPDAALEILDSSQAQLRLTHTEDTDFVDFQIDTNADLTITTSGTGQVIFQPTTDSTDFFQVLDADGGDPILNVDSTNEAVSVRTATNTYQFQGSNTQAKLFIEDADAGAQRTIVFSRSSNSAARGGQSSYLRARAGGTSVQNGDFIGYFNFEGHDGTDYNLSAQFYAIVDGAVSANTVPMAFVIKTGETGSGGTIDRFHVASDGDIGIGNVSSPLAQLHIDQFQTAEAQPVLLLDQADVDEPFTKYVGTAAAATLTRSIVAEADVTTATRQGFVKIEIEDIGNQVTDQDYFVAFYTLA